MLRFLALVLLPAVMAAAKPYLPLETTFTGREKFEAIAAKAQRGNWRALPIGDRIVKVALELEGVPYKAFTLEIHDRIESPSANFLGQDCWTFFEICLGMARMLETPRPRYTPQDLLREIEFTRYWGGKCRGNYLDRIHYLADWYADNQKRGTIRDITRQFPHQRMPPQCGEMTKLWKHYRYLKHNPELRAGMAKHEERLNRTAVYMVPKDRVAAIEPKLRNGDIIGIARNDPGSYCSHVGIIVVDREGKRRLMHASSTYKKVVIDAPISAYLARHKKQAGILVARPK